MHCDSSTVSQSVHPPYILIERFPAEDCICMEHHEQKELVLPVLQGHLPILHIDPVRVCIQPDLP